MRKLVALLFTLLSSYALAQTGSQKTSAALNNEINTLFPDNTGGIILPNAVRQVTLDLVASTFSGAAQVLGMNCNGIFDNAPAINAGLSAANTAGGGIVLLPGGSCGYNGRLTLYSNVHLVGAGIGVTTLKLLSNINDFAIYANPANLASVSDLTMDMGSYDGGANSAAILIEGSTEFAVERVNIKNIGRFGIAGVAMSYSRIANNVFSKVTASTSQNESILTSCAAGANVGNTIVSNISTNTGFELCEAFGYIGGNYITGWQFGAGITFDADPNSHDLQIIGNTATAGGGQPDSNAYYGAGFEIWATASRAVGNIATLNQGTGYDWGSANGSLIGNLARDNNQAVGVGGAVAGITCRVGSPSIYTCSGSTISGNSSYNTLGASGPQTYGYADQSSSVAGVQLSGNNFGVGSSGTVHLLGTINGWVPQGNNSALYSAGVDVFDYGVSNGGAFWFAAPIITNNTYIAGLLALLFNDGSQISTPANGTIHLGAADAASPAAQTLGVQGVVAGTSNTAGQDFKIAGSQGTGTGKGGNVRIQVAPAGTTGSAQNALADSVVFDQAFHARTNSALAPALTSCGTGSPSIVGTDVAGEVTLGTSAAGCIITFNVAYTSKPYCTVTWQNTPLASQSYTTSLSAITLTQTATSGNLVNYVCFARSGG